MRVRLGAACVSLALVAASSGCGTTATPSSQATAVSDGTTSSAAQSAGSVVAPATDGAVAVRATGCGPRVHLGTGTVLDATLAVTAAHVVAGADSVAIVDTSGGETTAEVVYFDPDDDVAALRTATPVGSPIELRSEPAAAGEAGVLVIPHPGIGVDRHDGDVDVDVDVDVTVIDVTVIRPVAIHTTDIYRSGDVVRNGYEIAGAVEPGDSGAMVQLYGGGAGIVWSKSTSRADRAWAVELPEALTDASRRTTLRSEVDTGPCI